ncbi:helix-turn-helix domain-containing protein [Dysgonomonas sp. 25]|uniref:helix-turn-helix domain-containing protein n=1 Tax=Dysgonomonas sp. 25 TaxID=2302933 RepID=UPI0013D041E4|nr:helix-turn-helix domain-containing protein [Dysgonomonas sp. 25]NDV70298.1 DNA-binding protein [Dysgonomonas sp. 25]
MKEAIILDSESFKRLVEKIDSIADFIKEKRESENTNLDEEWVDSYEVCTFLRISERTLQRLRTNGVITYSVISGKTYYTIAEIKRILKERLVKRREECLEELIRNHREYRERRKIRNK